MIITDEVLQTEFQFGMSAVQVEGEDVSPLRGLPEPDQRGNENVFALWINGYSETYFPREAEKVGESYLVDISGVKWKLTPLPEHRRVVFDD